MTYQVLARKYRPQTFKEVLGQEAIVTTIKNAIRLKKTAHAYLFSGCRGTGKTTLARLFAKALNCQNPTPELEPCCQCPSCLEIASGCSMDIIEIDGASNRGIDDIRQITETISFAPSSGFYKIYIIDEVHMLTKEAFNALLKTLEEPPATVKFFFATTESHKVLSTILSRCQRFDLSRISEEKIVEKLTQIALDLRREVSKDALFLIAKFAEGSLRDAESLFDEILCFEESFLTVETVQNILGLFPKDLFFELDSAVENQQFSFAFTMVENLLKSGKEFSFFLEELLEHYRHILLAKIAKTHLEMMHLPESTKKHYFQSSLFYSQEQCFYILDALLKAQQHFQKSSYKKVAMETLLLQILRSKNFVSLPSLVKKLSTLEKASSLPSLSKPEASLASANASSASSPAPSSPSSSVAAASIGSSSVEPPKDSSKEPSKETSKEVSKEPSALNEPASLKKEPSPTEHRVIKPAVIQEPQKAQTPKKTPEIQEILDSKKDSAHSTSSPSLVPKPPEALSASIAASEPVSPVLEKVPFLRTPTEKAPNKLSSVSSINPSIKEEKTLFSSPKEPPKDSKKEPSQEQPSPKNSSDPSNHSTMNASVVNPPALSEEKPADLAASEEIKQKSHYDTLLRFTAIELEGKIQDFSKS